MGRKKGKMLINVNDIIGKRLGKLKVISYYEYVYVLTRGGVRVRHFYVCKCDCGRTCIVQRNSLKNGIARSCGCLRKKQL